jgi:TRAP-type C4-dicarboxylate transport system substrate-binding protein
MEETMTHIGFRIAALAVAGALTTGPALAQAKIEIIMTNEVASTHWKTTEMNQYAEILAKKSNGRITAKVFPASQLYNDRDAVAALGTGAVHMTWPASVNLESIDQRVGVLILPFALSDERMMKPAFAKDVMKLISSFTEPKNIEVLALLRTTDLFFLFKDRPIRKLGDLKGQKVRVTGGRIQSDIIRSFGGSPTSMAASEMSMALATGAIDGIVTSGAAWARIVGITAKQASLVPSLGLLTYTVAVDKKWLDGLSPDDQRIIREAMVEFAATQWTQAIKKDHEEIDVMVKQGGTFWAANAEEAAPFRKAVESVTKAFEVRYPDAVKAFDDIVKRHGG